MRKIAALLVLLVCGWAQLAQAKTKPGPPPEEIVGVKFDKLRVKDGVSGKPIRCSDRSTQDTKVCQVLPYEYLDSDTSPEGALWGKVDQASLVVQTVGQKDLVLSAGVNWSVLGDDAEPVKARFRYLSEKLEKTLGPPTATTPPALGPTATVFDGLQEYRQFTDGNVSATLVLRQRVQGDKKKVSLSITYTDQKTLQTANQRK